MMSLNLGVQLGTCLQGTWEQPARKLDGFGHFYPLPENQLPSLHVIIPAHANEAAHQTKESLLAIERNLNVIFVSAEVAPYAKVGGLADVAGSLPKALAKLGHGVTVVMPAYRMVLDNPSYSVSAEIASFPVQVNPEWSVQASVRELDMDGVRVLLIGGGGFFESANSSETIYLPGIEQYAFFSHAALAACRELNLSPDVVHCNDWQTGFIPVLMRERFAKEFDGTATVFTIHNLAYQGEFGPEVLSLFGLPERLFNMHQLETWGRVNFLKVGCVYADQVNTVSPNYALEIQTPEYGCTLEGLMRHLADHRRLSGILNGIDLDFFDPESDPALPQNFGPGRLSGKAICKAALQGELDLPVSPDVPVMGIVSRLSTQKGLDLVLQIAPRLAELPGQLVVQGLGDPKIAEGLRELQARFPNSIRFVQAFNADLAQRVYAGSDMFLMPSAFEPCGLGQMIAMRYGTVPIVRLTGGLADTVADGVDGFVFDESDPTQFLATVERAFHAFNKRAEWERFIASGMGKDFSWDASAATYARLYHLAIAARPSELSAAAS